MAIINIKLSTIFFFLSCIVVLLAHFLLADGCVIIKHGRGSVCQPHVLQPLPAPVEVLYVEAELLGRRGGDSQHSREDAIAQQLKHNKDTISDNTAAANITQHNSIIYIRGIMIMMMMMMMMMNKPSTSIIVPDL